MCRACSTNEGEKRRAYWVLAGKPEEQRLLITITNIFNGQHRVDTLS
jgi:hypothetical protein